MKKIAIVPTLFTLGNGICGFAAITMAAKVTAAELAPADYEILAVAGWLIMAAMLFDMFDGYLARFAKSTSDFGGQLDSLCDAISFGVAPAFLMVRLGSELPGRVLWVVAVLYVVCTLLRLARFNCENTHELSGHQIFRGLPSPAAGGTIAAFAIMMPGLLERELPEFLAPMTLIALPFVMTAVAVLMVSRIAYPHVVNQVLRRRRSFGHLLGVVFALVAVVLIRELALPLLFCAFVLAAPLRTLWDEVVQRRPREEPLF